jgi:ketosteroid isomerase-like protein
VDRRRLERRLSLGGFGPLLADAQRPEEMIRMSNENVELIRRAYEAYSRGDLATMLQFVDPDLEWTYLDPSLEDPGPQVCHGRHELETALEGQAELGLKADLEEVIAIGDRVMVVVRTPGVDSFRMRKADDRNFAVLTVREGRIVALRDCRDREEAMGATGIE